MSKTKKSRLHLIFLGCAVGFLLVYLILTGVSRGISGAYPMLKTADRWEGDGDLPYAHMAVFFSDGMTFGPETLYGYRKQLNDALTAASVEAEDGTRILVDAYSGDQSVTVRNGDKSTAAVVTVTGGDYFIFHEPMILCGVTYTPDAMNYDTVVLDDVAAWQLFGSNDVCGMTVTINDVPLTVTGVIAREGSGAAFDSCYGTGARLYMPDEEYRRIGFGEPTVSCYEILMPDTVDDFAKNTVENIFNGWAEVKDLSNRFDDRVIFEKLRTYFDPPAASKTDYPWWERLQEAGEKKAEFLMMFRLAFGILGILFLLFELFLLILRRNQIFAAVKGFITSHIHFKTHRKKGLKQ